MKAVAETWILASSQGTNSPLSQIKSACSMWEVCPIQRGDRVDCPDPQELSVSNVSRAWRSSSPLAVPPRRRPAQQQHRGPGSSENVALTTKKSRKEAVTQFEDPGSMPCPARRIASGSVGGGDLANNAVSSSKIAGRSVTNSKIANGAVGTTNLGNEVVTTAKLAKEDVTTEKLKNDSVTAPSSAPTSARSPAPTCAPGRRCAGSSRSVAPDGAAIWTAQSFAFPLAGGARKPK